LRLNARLAPLGVPQGAYCVASYRLIINLDWGREFVPPMTSLRSEPAGLQRGEVEVHGRTPLLRPRAKSRDAPKYPPVRAWLARFLKSDVRPWVWQAMAWPVGSQW